MGWTLVVVMLVNGASTVSYYGFDDYTDCESAKSAAESVYTGTHTAHDTRYTIDLQCLENDPD